MQKYIFNYEHPQSEPHDFFFLVGKKNFLTKKATAKTTIIYAKKVCIILKIDIQLVPKHTLKHPYLLTE